MFLTQYYTQLRLALNDWVQGMTGPEQKNPVLQSGVWPRLTQCTVHIVPIGGTAAVIYLAISQTYWSDPSEPYTQTKLQGLKFAAKLYEVLICASLASIILGVVRRDLLGDDGVALGTLISAFNPTQLANIFSFGFWTGFGYRRRHRSSALLLALLVGGIVLGTAAGPSAAIAVIPRLGWWDADPFQGIGWFGNKP